MRARVLLALGVAGFAAFAALGVACLADLPDPTSPATEAGADTGGEVDAGVCPPPAQIAAASSCASALARDRGATCPDDASVASVMGCFAGDRSCLLSVNGECPVVDGGCFATGCPPVVSATYPSAACSPLLGNDVFYETEIDPAYTPCYCTSEQCAVQCDGIGSIIASGSLNGDAGPYVPISFDLRDHLPQGGGRLGFYARLRVDSATAGGGFFATFGTIPNAIRVEYPIVFAGEGIPLDGQFHELVFTQGYPGDGGAAGAVDSWSSPDNGPQTLVLTTANYQTIIEVDCVVPFFLPQ